MKIIVAPDSYKHSMTAAQAANAMEKGVKKVWPDSEVIRCPLADGGEGTLAVFQEMPGSVWMDGHSVDPLGRNISAPLVLMDGGSTAIIELANTAGLHLLSPEERNPLHTSTAGVGMQILHALDNGANTIILAIGGSSTNDGGMGMIRVLGGRFFDASDRELAGNGTDLLHVNRIDLSGLDKRIDQTRFRVLCDVNNPFYGIRGASRVFGPQKGADSDAVEYMEKGMINLAGLIWTETGVDLQELAGSGAAGGIGGGAAAILGADLVSGIEEILRLKKFDELLNDANLVFTGEGCTDLQTLEGKVPFGVLQKTRKAHVPLVILSGSLGEGANQLLDEGASGLFSIQKATGSLDDAINNGEELLEDAVHRVSQFTQEMMMTTVTTTRE